MKKGILAAALALLVGFAAGCHKAQNDQEAVRASIMKHLQARGGLNLAAMDVVVQQVAINGATAQAQAEFRVKQGGAGMRMSYALERREGKWVVLRSQPMGGEIAHPPMDSSQQQMPNFPNLHDIGKTPPAGGTGALPPGHPPVGQPANPPAQAPPPVPPRTP